MGWLANLIVLSALLFVSGASSSREATSADVNAELSRSFEQWMMKHGRVYHDENEKEKRFQIFKKTVAYVEAFNNADENTYELAVNKFADLTDEEFKATYTGHRKDSVPLGVVQSSFKYENVTNLPTSVDWRTKGAVTRVKSQGNCGACWAFSAVAAVEGIRAISSRKLIELSEQELIDCANSHGCHGGTIVSAFKYIKNNGLASERSYPYKGIDGTCDSSVVLEAHIKNFHHVPANSESALMKAVASQPVSVAIDSSSSSFRYYRGGVYAGDCGTKLDHDVTVVGYGVDDHGTKYWLVKNSWGTNWGESGYIRMKRGISDSKGLCGIAKQGSFPTL